MSKAVDNYKKYRPFLIELIRKDIKLKYRDSFMGLLWTLVEPFLSMLVLVFIFSNFLAKGNKGMISFPVYVLIGKQLYSYFSSATKASLKTLRTNAQMIRKVYVPKYMYPLASILSNYVTFVISLIVLVIVAIVEKVPLTWHIFEALIPMAILPVMTMGVGLLLASLSVFFRDLEYIWTVLLMFIMYTSAIFYDVSKIANGKNGWVFKVNPLYALIYNFRNAVFGEPMSMYHFWLALGFSVVMLIIGILAFRKTQDDFILYI